MRKTSPNNALTGSPSLTPQTAQTLFRRTLAAWASDSLRLRRAGLDKPSVRAGRGVCAAGWDSVGALRAAG